MTSNTYLAEAYTEGRSPGDRASREDAYQTIALCHIADMLTSIAFDIRALRENADRKGEADD